MNWAGGTLCCLARSASRSERQSAERSTSTETENRMLGEASDRLKQRAREMAGEQYEQVADSVRQIAERVLHQSDAAGPDAPGAASGDDTAGQTAERPNERAAMEAQRQGLGPV